MSLATKYRPRTLDEVYGQDSVVKILKRQVETCTFSNTYLFCGSSGCGKTTTARALSNAINGNLNGLIEIDAASNSGVDNVRSLTQSAKERSLDSKYKIYIIDECHSLSNQAWQAFLKSIEEPPKYTIFMFCTTEAHKVPATIKNRCMTFTLHRISPDVIFERLNYICSKEGFINYKETIEYISKNCNGEMRLAIALLEKCAMYSNNLQFNFCQQFLKEVSYESMFELINDIIDGNENKCLIDLSTLYSSGIDMKNFVNDFIDFCLDVSKYVISQSISVTKFPNSLIDLLNKSINFDKSNLFYTYYINKLLELKNTLKLDVNIYNTIQIYLLSMTRLDGFSV